MKKVLFVGFEPSYIKDVILRFTNIDFRILIPGNDAKVLSIGDNRCYLLNPQNSVRNNKKITSNMLKEIPIHKVIDSDRVLRNRKYSESIVHIRSIINSISYHVESYKPDLVFSTYDNAHSYLSYYVAQFNDLKWGAFFFTTIPKGYVTICRSIHDTRQLYNSNTVIGDSIVREAFESIESSESKVYMYREKKPGISDILKFQVFFKKEIGYNRMLWPTLTEKLYFEISKYRSRQFLRKSSNVLLDTSIDYVVYFMQMTPESTIDVWANAFRNQVSHIRLLRNSLAEKIKLIIKIHPSDPGGLSYKELKALQIDGIILDSTSNSIDLISKALFVVTVTGTPAIEAYILGKKALMFGPHPYSTLSSVYYFDKGLCELENFIGYIIGDNVLSRDERMKEFRNWMGMFKVGRLNNWDVPSTSKQIKALESLIIDQ